MARWSWAAGGGLVAAVAVAGFLRLRVGEGDPRSQSGGSDRVPTEIRVSRAARDDYFKDRARLNREIRLKPIPGPKPDSIESLVIDQVDENSPMFAAGFRKGDRILQVNDTPVVTLSRAINLVHEVERCSKLSVDVERNGRKISFHFEFN